MKIHIILACIFFTTSSILAQDRKANAIYSFGSIEIKSMVNNDKDVIAIGGLWKTNYAYVRIFKMVDGKLTRIAEESIGPTEGGVIQVIPASDSSFYFMGTGMIYELAQGGKGELIHSTGLGTYYYGAGNTSNRNAVFAKMNGSESYITASFWHTGTTDRKIVESKYMQRTEPLNQQYGMFWAGGDYYYYAYGWFDGQLQKNNTFKIYQLNYNTVVNGAGSPVEKDYSGTYPDVFSEPIYYKELNTMYFLTNEDNGFHLVGIPINGATIGNESLNMVLTPSKRIAKNIKEDIRPRFKICNNEIYVVTQSYDKAMLDCVVNIYDLKGNIKRGFKVNFDVGDKAEKVKDENGSTDTFINNASVMEFIILKSGKMIFLTQEYSLKKALLFEVDSK